MRSYSAILCILMFLALALPAMAGDAWGNGPAWGSPKQSRARRSSLPETQLLYNNDWLVPTQNRTQAMGLEAETGHINPYVDSILRPLLIHRNDRSISTQTHARLIRHPIFIRRYE